MSSSFIPDHRHRVVGHWLMAMAGMVFLMVVLGGLTRLTYSGLSMVDWRPVTGWLPPLSLEAWQAAFEAYRQTPEYIKINAGMSLDEFKSIFWLEYFHRLWGRLIGVAFLLPFLWFSFKGLIPRQRRLMIFGLFILGGLQGVLGWYMVMSGLVNDPAVSQYRLTAHLGMAFVISGALILAARSFYEPRQQQAHGCKLASAGVLSMIFLTILAGAMVAGLKAGYTYNTFPLMDGELIPSGMYVTTPLWANWFENVTTVQFNHRLLAILTLAVILLYVLRAEIRTRAMKLLALLAVGQALLGIATLVLVIPVTLAALHQAGGLVLFAVAIWHVHDVYTQNKGSTPQWASPTSRISSPS